MTAPELTDHIIRQGVPFRLKGPQPAGLRKRARDCRRNDRPDLKRLGRFCLGWLAAAVRGFDFRGDYAILKYVKHKGNLPLLCCEHRGG